MTRSCAVSVSLYAVKNSSFSFYRNWPAPPAIDAGPRNPFSGVANFHRAIQGRHAGLFKSSTPPAELSSLGMRNTIKFS